MSLEDKAWGFINSVGAGANRVADKINHTSDQLALKLKEKLVDSSLLPPRPPPPSFSSLHPAPESSLQTSLTTWISNHRWTVLLAATTLTGYGSYTIAHRLRKPPKRRAPRAPNGSRTQVVILTGSSPHDILTKTISVDLERRGFIVYVVCSSLDDEQIILQTGGKDLRPLHIDILDPESAHVSLENFSTYLSRTGLHLCGLLLISAIADAPHHRHSHPTGPVETIAASDWSDTLNLRLLSPFVTTQLFLKLLRSFQDSRLIVLTPSIISSLKPPFHAPESASVAAITAFSDTLRRELKPLGVHVSQLKLGTFDVAALTGRTVASTAGAARADIITWPPGVRTAYAHRYACQEAGKGVRGSNLKELHAAVFDALLGRKRNVVRVGSGSWVYEVVGRWAPDGLVLWMLGGAGGRDPREGRGVSGSRSVSQGSIEWEKVEAVV